MDLTSGLPPVSKSIFKLLPVEDILSCCLVNSTWREAVNTDDIWTRFCNVRVSLESVRSVVNCGFHFPQNNHLNPICDIRLKYMREICLRNNFRHNRSVDYKIINKTLPVTKEYMFLNNYRYLIVNGEEGRRSENSFDVWDMEHEQPPFHVETIPHLITQDVTDTCLTLGDYLLIIQDNLFQIYTVIEEKLTLKLCRIFNREENFSQSIPARDDIELWHYNNIRLKTPGFMSEIAAFEVADNYLFGVFRSPLRNISLNMAVMHIWDWASGKKFKIEKLPHISENISAILLGSNSQHLYLTLSIVESSGTRCKIYSYELKSLQYTQFYLEYDYVIQVVITDKRVVVIPREIHNLKKYILIDSVTGNLIVEKESNYPIDCTLLKSYSSLMAFGNGNIITVVDVVTQNEVAVLKVNFEPKRLHILDYNLLIVVRAGRYSFFEVWDFKKKIKLYRLRNTLLLNCDTVFPRLCVVRHNMIHILNYW